MVHRCRADSAALHNQRSRKTKRQNKSQIVEKLGLDSNFNELVSKLAKFANDNSEAVRDARPPLLHELNDRAQDNVEPLLAIADIAGGDWLKLARDALLKISKTDIDTDSIGVELLTDIKRIFETRSMEGVIRLKDLRDLLCENDESPWPTFNKGEKISTRQLSIRLKNYGITTKQHRHGNLSDKGYAVSDFSEAFELYVEQAAQDKDVS